MFSILNINEGWDEQPLVVVTYRIDNKENKLFIPVHVAKDFKTFPEFFRFIKFAAETRESM